MPSRKYKIFRAMILLISAGVTFVVALLVALMLGQRHLLYLPSRFTEIAALQNASQTHFQPWRNSDGELIGWKYPSHTTSTGSVLVMHGNAGSALNRDYFADPIHDGTSLDVYVLEYPGYGARAGSPSEKNFLKAAEIAFEQLPGKSPIYVVSESIGTGPATHLARIHGDRVAGMALFVPYGDLVAVAQNHFPHVPVGYLLWDRYAPAVWLRDYRGPIKFILAGQDEVIPAKLGQKLFDDYQGFKELQVFPHAHHNEVAAQSQYWWAVTLKFWEANANAASVQGLTNR